MYLVTLLASSISGQTCSLGYWLPTCPLQTTISCLICSLALHALLQLAGGHARAGGTLRPGKSEAGVLPLTSPVTSSTSTCTSCWTSWTVGSSSTCRAKTYRASTYASARCFGVALCIAQRSYFKPIQQKVKIKLFSFKHFHNEFILPPNGQTNTQSPFVIFFNFRERYLDYKSWEKKLITG
ncbi:hypothetical protein HPG69_011609 [Diceros bicornis minor]|uniref:Uncharacterized protein n=1 Tax=Diceros bicornis minor TaxID=77932 RepID=A0A7J7EIA6_DICBM|nr:hypothetical protein HPG69_011609 [Diceros bicornis minor]